MFQNIEMECTHNEDADLKLLFFSKTARNTRGSNTGKEILIKSVSGCLNLFTRSHIERKCADETSYRPCRGHIIKQDSLGSKAMTYNTPRKSLVTPIDKNCCRPK